MPPSLESIAAQLTAVKEQLSSLDRSIRGNGQIGIGDRLTTVTTRQNDCPARKGYEEMRKTQTKLVVKMAVVMVIINGLIWWLTRG